MHTRLKTIVEWGLILSLGILLAACSSAAAPTQLPAQPTITARPSETTTALPDPTMLPALTDTPAPTSTSGPSATPTPDVRPLPREWAGWPVVPTLSARAAEIYRVGVANGNHPNVVSVIGDCQSEPNVFLGIYTTDRYALGDQTQLQETIDFYHDSFSQQSAAVRDGLSAPSALSPLWADPQVCQSNENPVSCELRLRKPAIMFINLGTNWKAGASADRYGEYLRQIVDLVIANGTLPVLSTKADNVEGDHSLNQMTAQVAYEYDIPLWNFWLAADTLPNHGLDGERENVYLTPDGWNRRNFTALQTLDALRRALDGGGVSLKTTP